MKLKQVTHVTLHLQYWTEFSHHKAWSFPKPIQVALVPIPNQSAAVDNSSKCIMCHTWHAIDEVTTEPLCW